MNKKLVEHIKKIDFDSELYARKKLEKNENGNIIVDPFDYSSDIRKLIDLLIHSEYQTPFDWLSWDEGEKYFKNPDEVLNASKEDLIKLTTTILRQKRFSTGTIASVIDSGLLENICKRIIELENHCCDFSDGFARHD